MERIMITIPTDLLKDVDLTAKRLKRNRSQLVRQALVELLGKLKQQESEAFLAKGTKMVPETKEDDETWFLSEGWQKRHHKAVEDIEEGRVYGPFENAEDLLKSLKS